MHHPKLYSHNERGLTLIEISLVIVLIAIISTLGYSRIEVLVLSKQKAGIRRLVNTWEMLFNESLARGEAYRLFVNINDNSYYVRREIKLQQHTTSRKVDFLKNLRTKGEQKRRREKSSEEELLSLEEEFAKEDERQGGDLETLFFISQFADPEGNLRLARPLEFPSLAKQQTLPHGVSIRDIKTEHGVVDEGQISIRFSPRGTSEFAVIHFLLGEAIVTALLNPWTGESEIFEGDRDFEWTLDKKQI